jgi:hypothetical protein
VSAAPYILGLNPKNLRNSKAVIERVTGKRIEQGFPVSNGKVSYLAFQDDFVAIFNMLLLYRSILPRNQSNSWFYLDRASRGSCFDDIFHLSLAGK